MKLSPVDYNPFVAGEDVIRNVKYVESRGNPNAVSPKGAVGTMQTMPSTLKDPGFGVAPAKNTSSDELERVGKDYFDAMYEKYGDMDKALAAYNFGPGNLDNAITKYGENWKKGLPTETKEYIEKVNSQPVPGPKLIPVDFDPFAKEDAKKQPTERSNDALLNLIRQTVSQPNPKLTAGQEIARAVSPYARPVLELGGAIGGGILGGATGALGVNPATVAAGSALGAGLGYAGGSGIANVIDEYAGLKRPPTLASGLVNTANDVAFGAANELTGQLAGPVLSLAAKGVGKVLKPTIGAMSGAGEAAVSNAIKSGYQTGLRSNPLKSATTFDKAMRGKIDPDEIVDVARGAISELRETRGANYRAVLDEISSNNKSLDITPINDTMRSLMTRYNIKIEPNGALDVSRASVGKKSAGDLEEIVDLVRNWGNKDGDLTPTGLDILKRRLDDFYSDSSQARQFVTELKKSVSNTISKEVPQYAEMTKGYQEATSLIKDIESTLMLRKQGMTGRVTADMTLRRIASAMKDNNELRLDMVRLLGKNTGNELEEMVAGYAMNKIVPGGLTKYAAGGAGTLAAMLSPKFLPIVASASPRVQGEFLRIFGKGLREAGAFNKTMTAPMVKTGGILLRGRNNE